MRHYTLKPSVSSPPSVCPQAIPIDPIDISSAFDTWKEDPATNRQQKVLKFFNYSFPPSITKGIANSYISRIFRNLDHQALWNRYVDFTNDIRNETPDLNSFNISDLLAADLSNKCDPPANTQQVSMRAPVAIFGSDIPKTVIVNSGPPPPSDAQIEFLKFIGEVNIPALRRVANNLITQIVFPVRRILSRCFYNLQLIDETSERNVVKAIRNSNVWNDVVTFDFAAELPDELKVALIRIVFEVIPVTIRDGLKIKGIQKLKPFFWAQELSAIEKSEILESSPFLSPIT